MASLISFFGSEVEETIQSWPLTMKSDLRQYLGLSRGKAVTAGKLHARMTDQPYWLLLPFWLAERFAHGNAKVLGKRFMSDILWAQYCLFVVIRIQDDLFDKHTACLSLIYAADGFLFEADRVLSKYFRNTSRFREIYTRCIEETILAVASADDLQCTSMRSNRRLLSYYGRTSDICNIAAAAVCLRAGQMRKFSRITVFSREMMMAGAIVDDLLDIAEDIQRGRLNFTVPFLLPRFRIKKSLTGKALCQISRNSLASDGTPRIFREIYRHVGSRKRLARRSRALR